MLPKRSASVGSRTQQHLHGVAGVGAQDEQAIASEDLLAQYAAKHLCHRAIDIEAVDDDREDALRVFREHVAIGIDFVIAAPRGHGAVLGGDDGSGGHPVRGRVGAGVVRAQQHVGDERVRGAEVDQVRGAAEAGGLLGGDAAIAEVVEHHVGGGGIFSAALHGRFEDVEHSAGERGDSGRIPDLEQQRLQKIGEPVAGGVGVADGHQDVERGHRGAFGDGADLDRKAAAVMLDNVHPAGAVEDAGAPEVCGGEAIGGGDILGGDDASREIAAQVGLQAEKDGLREAAAARFQIAVDLGGAGRVLAPVRELVAVATQGKRHRWDGGHRRTSVERISRFHVLRPVRAVGHRMIMSREAEAVVMAAGKRVRLSVLDQSPVPAGSTPGQALQNSIELARLVDALGYTRFWMSEHHAMDTLACTAPEMMLARIGAETKRIRIGSGGIMLPHYTAFKVAEVFRTLHALYPGRVDLGIGRAPGGGPMEAHGAEARPEDEDAG